MSRQKRKKLRRWGYWSRDVAPPAGKVWKYGVMMTAAVERSVSIERFEEVITAIMDDYKDDDFLDWNNRLKVPPDTQVKLNFIDMNKDSRKMMMIMPLLVDGKRRLYCQLTQGDGHEIILDPSYKLTMGNQRAHSTEG
jgi:hypothetical protein